MCQRLSSTAHPGVQVAQLNQVAARYADVVTANAELHNQVLDLRGAIRVFARVRPEGTTGDASPVCVATSEDNEVCVLHVLCPFAYADNAISYLTRLRTCSTAGGAKKLNYADLGAIYLVDGLVGQLLAVYCRLNLPLRAAKHSDLLFASHAC